MIGFVRGLLEDHVLSPQGTDVVPAERRATLHPEREELGVVAQQIDVLALTTEPVSFEIGGGMTLRHRLDVAVVVQHGDSGEATRIRDLLVLDLALRALDATPAIMAALDEGTGQYVTDLRWTVDYRPLPGLAIDTPNETATIVFTIETQLDR